MGSNPRGSTNKLISLKEEKMYICKKCKEEFKVDVAVHWNESEAVDFLYHIFYCFYMKASSEFDAMLLDNFFDYKAD